MWRRASKWVTARQTESSDPWYSLRSSCHLLHRILGEPVGCNNDNTQKCRLQKHLQQNRENQPRHANLSTLSQHGILEDCLQESWRVGRLNFTFLYLVPYLLLSSSWDLVILLKSRTTASQLPWSVCVSALCSLQWADYLFVSSKGRLFFPQISFCSNIILRFELLMPSPQSRPILSWLASSTICKSLPVLRHMLSYCSICQIVLWVASSTYCYKCGPASFIFGAITNVGCK